MISSVVTAGSVCNEKGQHARSNRCFPPLCATPATTRWRSCKTNCITDCKKSLTWILRVWPRIKPIACQRLSKVVVPLDSRCTQKYYFFPFSKCIHTYFSRQKKKYIVCIPNRNHSSHASNYNVYSIYSPPLLLEINSKCD